MSSLLLGTLVGSLLGWLMGFLSVFLVLLVLIQRGKGGGLTGALGGPGGQSAFGSKAGDTFTVITIVVASIWGFTCAFTMWLLGTHSSEPVAKARVQAGPGDSAAETESMPLDFPMGDLPSGTGFEISGDLEVDSGSTPSMDLIPANRPSDASADTPADEGTGGEGTGGDDSTEAASPATDSPAPAADASPETADTPAETTPADESNEGQ